MRHPFELCLLSLAFVFGSLAPVRAEEGVVRGSIINVLPQGIKSVVIVNRGERVGLRVGQVGSCSGLQKFKCRVTEVYEFRSKCIAEIESRHIDARECAFPLSPIVPPPTLTRSLPARGVREPAKPVVLAHSPPHGLVAASPCVGFTPDERGAYLLRPGTVGLPPANERWLELVRFDFATGGMTPVKTFSPALVSTARAQLVELIAREELLACHAAVDAPRSTTGDLGLMAHHTLDRILFWGSDSVIYAAMEGGAGLADRVGRGALEAVWFVPGFAVHLGQAGNDWQVLEVR